VIGAWLVLALAVTPLQSKLQERAADESDTFLVRGSDSAEAKRLIDARFRSGSEMAAVIAYFRDTGITAADRERMKADAMRLCRSRAIPSLTRIGTPDLLACGQTDPLDLSPGRSLLLSGEAVG
jgi:putative drug exporter of the RND superfamily